MKLGSLEKYTFLDASVWPKTTERNGGEKVGPELWTIVEPFYPQRLRSLSKPPAPPPGPEPIPLPALLVAFPELLVVFPRPVPNAPLTQHRPSPRLGSHPRRAITPPLPSPRPLQTPRAPTHALPSAQLTPQF